MSLPNFYDSKVFYQIILKDHDKDIAKFIQATDEVDTKSESEYSMLYFFDGDIKKLIKNSFNSMS